ncbi:ABC transporter substrate-binding protein [Granulosicoccus antarcticus]|uniref:Putative ABC transporter-binding protein n=1 Tax=Granulosicoccus antarcticus IMCC3135 TaxID=1192854 RepID=A0A2Z2NNQ0_9GAMM|nr:ABC transporter substrate-binding protein [Granulosicoccus antarcticus]ASJ71561.1 putative ABC transporter-binding protein [Granulosicoccus antarcticus IMCC3135]
MKFLKKRIIAVTAVSTILLSNAVFAEDLVLSIGSRGYGAAVGPALESFEAANPDIKVEWLKVSDVPSESRKLYVTSLMARSATPDVFSVDVIWPGEFAQRRWIAPIGEDFTEEELAQFNPSFMEAATVDGKIYGVPLYVDGTQFFYRSDLLEKYDLPVPKTWEEVIASSRTILDGENNPDLSGFVSMWAKIEGLFMNWLSFTYSNGATFFDENGNVTVNSPEAIEATQTMVDMLYKHKIVPESILNMRPDDARTLFQQGRAVFMMVQDFVYAPLSADDSPVKGKFDFTRNPYFAAHPDAPATAMGGFLLAVNANSEHRDAAVKLVKHMTSYESQLAAAVNESKSPGLMNVYDDASMQDNQVLQKFGKAYAAGVVRPSAGTGSAYPKVSDAMQVAITSALHQSKTVEEALNDAQATIEKLLDQ